MVQTHEKMKPGPLFQAFKGESAKPVPENPRRYELRMRSFIREEAHAIRGVIIPDFPVDELKGKTHQILRVRDRCG